MKKLVIGAVALLAAAALAPVLLLMGALMLWATASQSQTQASGAAACEASWQGEGVSERDLTRQQLDAAATIYAEAQAAGVGAAGAVVGIATALQESDLGQATRSHVLNSDGDIGLFQQRAHVGWYADGATLAENAEILLDHSYASRTFFLGHDSLDGYHIPGLVDIEDWQNMTLTQAVQAVQVSAFPDAYAKHEALARSLVNHLGEGAAGQILCSNAVGGSLTCPASGLRTESGLSPDALRTLRCIKHYWPQIDTIGGKRVDVGSDHHTGNAIDPMIPNWDTPEGIALGDEIASWAQTNATGLGVTYVIWQRQIWSTARASEGWRTCGAEATCYAGTDPSAAHLDHVHISVAGNAGTGTTAGQQAAAGDAVLPIEKGVYRLTARHNQAGDAWSSGFHTGLDFAAPQGTPIRAVTAGTILDVTWHSAYGNLTKLQTTNGTVVYYAHQATATVTRGQPVLPGQQIGTVGNTGNSRGAHLHLEVRIGGRHTDPEQWLTQQGLQP